MPPREDRETAACVEISALEREVLDRMKAAAGVATEANLIRIALWSLGDHLGLDMPNGAFDLRERKGWIYARKRANPKVRQHELFPRAKPKKPASDHPWREPLAGLLPKKGV